MHLGQISTYFGFYLIDENLPDLSGIPDLLFARFFPPGYGHRHISGALNFIKIYFSDVFCQAILIYVSGSGIIAKNVNQSIQYVAKYAWKPQLVIYP